MKNIAHLLDVIDQVRDHMALGLMSDPGLSKTAQVKQWAADNGRAYCELIISQRMPSEISGMPMPVNETQKMEIFDFNTLLELKNGDVLAFDEFTNGNIQTLNACLTLIQERTMLSGKKLPSLVVVAMGNPQGRCELLPQTKQRFWWVDVDWDADTWKAYMQRTWGITVSPVIVSAIRDQYMNGFTKSDVYNFYTPRTMENLFRVAMTIPEDDSFWLVSAVARDIVRALYTSLKGADEFGSMMKPLLEWARARTATGFSEMDRSYANLLLELSGIVSVDALKSFIAEVEASGRYPDFIAFLKQQDEPRVEGHDGEL